MIPGGSVTFTYEWECEPATEDDEYEYVDLEVSATISDYYPAVRYLRNGDPGYPAEGGEVEDLTVTMPDGTEMKEIPDDLYEALCDKAIEEHGSM